MRRIDHPHLLPDIEISMLNIANRYQPMFRYLIFDNAIVFFIP